jgi:serine/threonine protein kinase
VENVSELATALAGRVIDSETTPGVRYRILHPLGEGGMAVALYANRESAEGVTPAVLKVVKPEIVGTAGPTALLMIQKEAIALGRLNERVPPTPFVVRFMDTGTIVVPQMRNVELPWIAVEYVHGGTEGTTIEQRVQYSVANTRFAFDPARAAHTIDCLADGLTAIHEVGVVHRDLTPGNILCCGFGSGEVMKIADFGIARPSGIQATFGGVLLGTPGYAAPEQSFSTEGEVGPWTDVFSFACLAYFAIAGEQYFDTSNFAQALMMVRSEKRKSLAEATALSPELRDNPAACRVIDQVLAHATAMVPSARPPDARAFAGSLLPALRAASGPRSQRASERLVRSLATRPMQQTVSRWSWMVRHPPGDERLVRGVAWDSAGHCLAVTTEGLYFWNGTTWLPARAFGKGSELALRSVSLVRPGQWLLGGADGFLALLGSDGSTRIIHAPPGADFTLVSGDPEDLALVVAERAGAPPLLYSIAADHFFRPTPLDAARSIAALARVDASRWLISGRTVQGSGFAAVYSALDLEPAFLLVPPTDALTACAGHVDRGLGVAGGRRGVTVRFDGAHSESGLVDGAPDLASAAMDVQGRAWVGASGKLWSQAPEPRAPWVRAWEDATWRTPFVSLRADLGVLTAVTVDGAVLEGRLA